MGTYQPGLFISYDGMIQPGGLLVELGCCSLRKDWNMKNNWLVVDLPL